MNYYFVFLRVSPTVHVCNNNWFTDVRYICTYACWGWNSLPQVMFRFAISIVVSMRKRMNYSMIFRGGWGPVLFGLVCIDLLGLFLSIDLCQWQLLVYDCIIDYAWCYTLPCYIIPISLCLDYLPTSAITRTSSLVCTTGRWMKDIRFQTVGSGARAKEQKRFFSLC